MSAARRSVLGRVLRSRGFLFFWLLLWCYVAYAAVFEPASKQLQRQERKEYSLRQVFEKKQQYASGLEALKAQQARMQEMFAALTERLPAKMDTVTLQRDLQAVASDTGLRIVRYEVGAGRDRDFYSETPVTLELSGSFRAVAEFIKTVSARGNIMTPTSVVIAPAKAGTVLCNMTVKLYNFIEGS